MMVRLSATEYVDGGYSVDDVVALSKALEAAGVVAIDLSGGTNETPELSRYLHPATVVSTAVSGALCAADQGCRRCAGDHGRPDR